MTNRFYGVAQKNRINSLDAIKCLAIFAVICVHSGFYDINIPGGVIIDSISRFAVPIFFLISGFFSYFVSQNISLSKYKNRIIKLLKLLIISNIVYFIFYMFVGYYDGMASILQIFDVNCIIDYILLDTSPTAVHLWFIQALIYCYVLYYVLVRLNISLRTLYKFVPLLLFMNLFIGEFATYWGLSFPGAYSRNFLFTGLPFFTLGYYICENESIINTLSDKSLILIMVLGCFLTIIETLTAGNLNLYIGSILISISLFILCIKNPSKLNFKITNFIGGNLYTSMYILHFMIAYIILTYFNMNIYFIPVIVFIITAFVSTVIYYCNKIIFGSTKLNDSDDLLMDNYEHTKTPRNNNLNSRNFQKEETPEEMEARIRSEILRELEQQRK